MCQCEISTKFKRILTTLQLLLYLHLCVISVMRLDTSKLMYRPLPLCINTNDVCASSRLQWRNRIATGHAHLMSVTHRTRPRLTRDEYTVQTSTYAANYCSCNDYTACACVTTVLGLQSNNAYFFGSGEKGQGSLKSEPSLVVMGTDPLLLLTKISRQNKMFTGSLPLPNLTRRPMTDHEISSVCVYVTRAAAVPAAYTLPGWVIVPEIRRHRFDGKCGPRLFRSKLRLRRPLWVVSKIIEL